MGSRQRFYQPVLAGLLVAWLSACESPLSPSELRALGRAEARWAGRSFRDYGFEIRRSCFCEPLVAQWAHVEVVAGQVSRVVLLATGAEVSREEHGRFPTIEHVFASIRAATEDEWLEDITVHFDPELGYPTRVVYDSKPDILDGGSISYLRNAGPPP